MQFSEPLGVVESEKEKWSNDNSKNNAYFYGDYWGNKNYWRGKFITFKDPTLSLLLKNKMKVPKDEKPRSKSVSNNLYSFFNIFSTLLDLVRRGTAQFSRTHPSFFVVGVGGMLANIFQDEQCNWLYKVCPSATKYLAFTFSKSM